MIRDGWDLVFMVGVLALIAIYLRSWGMRLNRNGVPVDREDEP